MIPILSKVNLKNLPLKQQKRICQCKQLCDEAVSLSTYNDGLLLCWNDARRHLYGLINLMDDGKYTSWSQDDEKFIIALVKEKGIYNGINRDIADALGKSYAQVKSKTRRMKEKGLI